MLISDQGMESPLSACRKKNIFSSVNSHSYNTVFFAADSFASGMDFYFGSCFNYTFESSAGKSLINFDVFQLFLNILSAVCLLKYVLYILF